MKIDFVIISAILVIISFLPFILFPLLQSKERKNLKRKFKEEALKSGLNISYELAWNTNIAGIDLLKNQFLFVQKPDIDFVVQYVDLTKVNEVKLIAHNDEALLQKRIIQTLNRVELEFLDNSAAGVLTVNLYDNKLNYIQDFEMKNAEKLIAEMQKCLTARPVIKHTA